MSEYDDWQQARELDPEALGSLLLRLSGAVARTKTYRWPEHDDSWSDAAVQELARKVYASKDPPEADKRLALKIFQKATGQESLERLLVTTIENVLIDEAKATETGKLRRRLVGVLGKDDRFVHIPSQRSAGHWTGARSTCGRATATLSCRPTPSSGCGSPCRWARSTPKFTSSR